MVFRPFFKGFTKNMVYKVFAFIIAVLLWFASVKNRVITEYISIPVTFNGLSDDMVIADYDPETVRFKATGKGVELMALKKNDLAYRVNMRGFEKGVYEMDVDKRDIAGADNIALFDKETSVAIRVRIEEKVAKTVPVKAIVTGEPPGGYKLVQPIEVIPAFVSIRGPKSVKEIKTFPIDVTGMTSSFRKEVQMDIPENTTLEVQSDRKVFATMNIVRLKKVEIKEIPLEINGEYSLVFPKVVSLSMEVPVSTDISNLKKDVHVRIDLTEHEQGSHNIVPEIEHPSWVNLIDLHPRNIQVIIE